MEQGTDVSVSMSASTGTGMEMGVDALAAPPISCSLEVREHGEAQGLGTFTVMLTDGDGSGGGGGGDGGGGNNGDSGEMDSYDLGYKDGSEDGIILAAPDEKTLRVSSACVVKVRKITTVIRRQSSVSGSGGSPSGDGSGISSESDGVAIALELATEHDGQPGPTLCLRDLTPSAAGMLCERFPFAQSAAETVVVPVKDEGEGGDEGLVGAAGGGGDAGDAGAVGEDGAAAEAENEAVGQKRAWRGDSGAAKLDRRQRRRGVAAGFYTQLGDGPPDGSAPHTPIGNKLQKSKLSWLAVRAMLHQKQFSSASASSAIANTDSGLIAATTAAATDSDASTPSKRTGASAAGQLVSPHGAPVVRWVYRAFPLQELAISCADSPTNRASAVRVWSYEGFNTGRRLFLASDWHSFSRRYWMARDDQRHAYEIIRGGEPCRLYCDLEFSKVSNPGDEPNNRGSQLGFCSRFARVSLFCSYERRLVVLTLPYFHRNPSRTTPWKANYNRPQLSHFIPLLGSRRGW